MTRRPKSLTISSEAPPSPSTTESNTNASVRSPDSLKSARSHSLKSPKLSKLFAKTPSPSAVSPAHPIDPPLPLTKAQLAAAALDARNSLRHVVRDDWTWPPPSADTAFGGPRLPPTTQWRERDVSLSPARRSAEPEASTSTAGDPGLSKSKADDVSEMKQLATDSRCRRQQEIEHELASNEGLRLFQDRRDAWTRAKKVNVSDRKYEDREDVTAESDSTIEGSPDTNRKIPPNCAEVSSDQNTNTRTLIPVGPPILAADHPVRVRIVPSAYASIYSRVAVQGTTPNVPINLADMTQILVQGWKNDGEWPPRSSVGSLNAAPGMARPTSPPRGRRKTWSARKGSGSLQSGAHEANTVVGRSVGKFKRALHLRNSHEVDPSELDAGIDAWMIEDQIPEGVTVS